MQTTPARSSRITTSRRRSAVSALGLKRTTSSPSNASPSKRSLPTEVSTAYDEDEELDDLGFVVSLASDLNFRDVPQYMEYIRNRMFSDMPEKAGMNSTRIAEVLNFRKSLPPFVTIAHVDALSTSSTAVEREIAELAKEGIVRRVTIPHRGVGARSGGRRHRERKGMARTHQGTYWAPRPSQGEVHRPHVCLSNINNNPRLSIHTRRNRRTHRHRLPHLYHSTQHHSLRILRLSRRCLPLRNIYIRLSSRSWLPRSRRRPTRDPTHARRHFPTFPHTHNRHILLLAPAHGNAHQAARRRAEPPAQHPQEEQVPRRAPRCAARALGWRCCWRQHREGG
jgi:hypothetical protein